MDEANFVGFSFPEGIFLIPKEKAYDFVSAASIVLTTELELASLYGVRVLGRHSYSFQGGKLFFLF